MSNAVSSLDRIVTFAEFAKKQAIQGQLPPVVAEIADDIKNIARLEKDLLVRQSPVAGTIHACAERAISQGVQELSQYQQQPPIQELVVEVQTGLQTLQQLPGSTQQMGQQLGQPGHGQYGWQQGRMGGQTSTW